MVKLISCYFSRKMMSTQFIQDTVSCQRDQISHKLYLMLAFVSLVPAHTSYNRWETKWQPDKPLLIPEFLLYLVSPDNQPRLFLRYLPQRLRESALQKGAERGTQCVNEEFQECNTPKYRTSHISF